MAAVSTTAGADGKRSPGVLPSAGRGPDPSAWRRRFSSLSSPAELKQKQHGANEEDEEEEDEEQPRTSLPVRVGVDLPHQEATLVEFAVGLLGHAHQRVAAGDAPHGLGGGVGAAVGQLRRRLPQLLFITTRGRVWVRRFWLETQTLRQSHDGGTPVTQPPSDRHPTIIRPSKPSVWVLDAGTRGTSIRTRFCLGPDGVLVLIGAAGGD